MKKQQKNHHANASTRALPPFLIKRLSEGSFILVLAAAFYLFLSLLTYRSSDPSWLHQYAQSVEVMNAGGQVGAYLADFFYFLFGFMAYLFPLSFVYLAWVILMDCRILRTINRPLLVLRSVGLLFLFGGGCGLLSIEWSTRASEKFLLPGGVVGQLVSSSLNYSFNPEGSLLFLLAMLLVGVTWLTGLSWIAVVEWVGWSTHALIHGGIHLSVLIFKQLIKAFQRIQQFRTIQSSKPRTIVVKEKRTPKPAAPVKSLPIPTLKRMDKSTNDHSATQSSIPALAKTALVEGLPSLSLLDVSAESGKSMNGYSHDVLESLSHDVEQHLLDFGIQADVVSVHPGPVITRFELQLAAGIKVSKLTALAKDLARSLSVMSVRVVEIIPGKTVVGIEIPNPNRTMVRLSEVLSAEVYQKAHSPLSLALGVDIAGHPMIVDLAKMPHLLVAGTTGSGKSVGINAMILSLLFKASPEMVRLIMVDPKMLELSVYDGIPHLLTPVVTDMKEAASALRWCVAEMERRYRLMASMGVRNLSGFNAKILEARQRGETLTDPAWKPVHSMDEQAPALEPLPYIVVIIDELADMMMVVGKKVEQLIARIAQKARAAGIHLILATQRPSVDVLTGLIKSNIPTRISFQVSSKIDSRTILDQQGADQLLGHGDMLFLAPGTGTPLRVHGAFVDDQEVHRIADDWRARGEPSYVSEITQLINDASDGDNGDSTQEAEDADPLYDQVVEFVLQTRKASISSVQRRFKIGYNRAARLVEEMERTGLVGPLEGGFRDVLVPFSGED